MATFRVEIESTQFEGICPKGGGKWEHNIGTDPASVVYALVDFGLKRKVANLCVNWHLQSEYEGFGGKRVRKEEDEIFASQGEMTKRYQEELQKLWAAFAKGDFGFEGTYRGNPVATEMWTILFKRAGISGKDQSKARALRQEGIVELIVQAHAKGTKLSAESMKKKVGEYLEKLRVDAEAVVAMRGEPAEDSIMAAIEAKIAAQKK
jgi:hypothetical protein